MVLDPNTGKDKYLTDPVPEGKPLPVEPQDASISDTAYTCTLSISCATILDNMDWLDPEKVELVPEDGWILEPTAVTFYEGESVFNVLQRTCKQKGIHMEFENTPMYNSAYIEGIHNLYEFDCGELSGWMYKVNEWFPNYGCSRYQLKDGDVICWEYTCDLGVDVGGFYSTRRLIREHSDRMQQGRGRPRPWNGCDEKRGTEIPFPATIPPSTSCTSGWCWALRCSLCTRSAWGSHWCRP